MARFAYALACRDLYLAASLEGRGEDVDYIGRFKAESIENFERLSLDYPEFAPSYYYLGYAYLNMGLYKKAELCFREFLRRADEGDEGPDAHGGYDVESWKEEVGAQLAQLDHPVVLEEGCNAVLAGRWEDGIVILEPYLETDYAAWWPLSYYLGIAYAKADRPEEAVTRFRHALGLNPSQRDCMEELAEVYEFLGEAEKAEKYRRKLEIL